MCLLEGFIYGVIGGIFAELLGLFKLRQESRETFPKWISSVFYWVITALMTLAGGALVVVYLKSGIDLKPIIAVNIGASAPLLIGAFVAQAPNIKIN
jgi:hypothetical protein